MWIAKFDYGKFTDHLERTSLSSTLGLLAAKDASKIKKMILQRWMEQLSLSKQVSAARQLNRLRTTFPWANVQQVRSANSG
jgi:hypothetical protein